MDEEAQLKINSEYIYIYIHTHIEYTYVRILIYESRFQMPILETVVKVYQPDDECRSQ